MSLTIIGRGEWGARYPDGFADAPLPAEGVYLHHTVTVAPDLAPPFTDDDAAVRTLERIGQERFGGGISYTFAITPVGRVYEGHSVWRRGAHTKGLNTTHRAIALIGDYTRTAPTPQMVESCAALLVHGRRAGWWIRPRLEGGHRDAPGASTSCPGDAGHAAIAKINQRAAVLAADSEDEGMSIENVRIGVHGLLKEAASGSTATGRQVAQYLQAVIRRTPILFARTGQTSDLDGALSWLDKAVTANRQDIAAVMAVLKAIAARPADAAAISEEEIERMLQEAAQRVQIRVEVTPPAEG